MTPKEGSQCDRTCGGGVIDSFYKLINGPSSCAESSGKNQCNTHKCAPPCLIGGNCIVEGFLDLPTKLTNIQSSSAPLTDKTMNYEANLLEALYLFNNEYAFYVSNCNNKAGTTIPDGAQNTNRKNCTELLIDINANKDKIINYTNTATNGFNPKPLQSVGNYKDNNNKIASDYSNLTNMRTDLDEKLRELYDVPGSQSLDYRYNLDSTIYSGILVTIAATALIYYTFTKL